jgi:hypothetical protein
MITEYKIYESMAGLYDDMDAAIRTNSKAAQASKKEKQRKLKSLKNSMKTKKLSKVKGFDSFIETK